MKKILIIFLFACFGYTIHSQQNQISLEDIWEGKFRTERLQSLHSMENGQEYTVLNFDYTNKTSAIDVYDYRSQKKIKSLLDSKELEGVSYFIDYQFSDDEKKILLTTESKPVFRHSTLGTYYIYDIASKSLSLLSENKVQEPVFSPNSSKVAFVFENNIYIKDLINDATIQITNDGKPSAIINGVTDWVYEEEFSFVRAFDWNAHGTKIAYLKFDESEVPQFSMVLYGKYGRDLYPDQHAFKYPKAGEKNAEVSLHIYDLNNRKTQKLLPPKDYKNFYIPRIQWTKNADVLSAQYTNRHQNKLDLWLYNAKNNTYKLAVEQTDPAYVDVTFDLTFLEDDSFLWTSEKDGFNHIYHYDKFGNQKNQITMGDWEVTSFYGFDTNNQKIFYQSTENGNINRDIYSIDLNGENKQKLTQKTGTNNADFSSNFSYFINTFSNATTPYVITLNNAKTGEEIKTIKNNNALVKKLKKYKRSQKEFSTISINGEELNMWTMKPLDFDPNKQYPLFMYQYSGPGSQQVANRWWGANDYWHSMLTQMGIIVVCIDGRGTGYKGRDFKKVTQKELGKYEVADQIAAAKQLGALQYIDASRIGIWGWSYGGFMSSNCLFQGNEVFSMAIAVAPVTSWRFYDTIYTERYMITPQENPEGYDQNSPITHVDKLKGDFLLIHGSADDNVHVQNTMQMVEALIQANKQFEWMIYPDKNHGIYGGNTRLHLYTKMTDFIKRTLLNK